MAKILLVEDDSNLREIYAARLEAEGYTVVTGADGEEGLAVAVKERPDLVIADVMMPKIGGFDMLDILRTTPETKDVKVIVMTALSQDEDRERGEKLGANKYFVKSQVVLEDLVASVKELLADVPETANPVAPAANPETTTPRTENAATPQAPTDLNGDVQDFVSSSPLMNNAPDQPATDAPEQPTPPQA